MKDRQQSLEAIVGPVSRETVERLRAFEASIRKWNPHINLVAPSTLGEIWERHILDSAQLHAIRPRDGCWVDIGSGGGFPGAIVAILRAEHAYEPLHLIESNRKKTSFLKTTLASMDIPALVHPCRVEDSYDLMKQPDIVSARALAPLSTLCTLTEPWIGRKAIGLFQKGREYRSEIDDCGKLWDFDLIVHDSVFGQDSVILELSGLKRRSN